MKPRIEDMHPDLLKLYLEFAELMVNRGVRFGLSCVVRTHAEQEAFWAQGRGPLEDVNAKRMTAGMRTITEKENVIVTHTLKSRHFPDENGKSRAFDIVIFNGLDDGGGACWDMKYDGQGDGVPDYEQAAQLGKLCGLECGAFWNGFKDYPHYQLPG